MSAAGCKNRVDTGPPGECRATRSPGQEIEIGGARAQQQQQLRGETTRPPRGAQRLDAAPDSAGHAGRPQ
jgi:hypothetical protein